MTKLEATAYLTGSLFILLRNHSDKYLASYPKNSEPTQNSQELAQLAYSRN